MQENVLLQEQNSRSEGMKIEDWLWWRGNLSIHVGNWEETIGAAVI